MNRQEQCINLICGYHFSTLQPKIPNTYRERERHSEFFNFHFQSLNNNTSYSKISPHIYTIPLYINRKKKYKKEKRTQNELINFHLNSFNFDLPRRSHKNLIFIYSKIGCSFTFLFMWHNRNIYKKVWFLFWIQWKEFLNFSSYAMPFNEERTEK